MTASDILSLTDRVEIGLDAGESHFREFKSALVQHPDTGLQPRDPKDISRDIGDTLVAFANADGGELLVGVEDDGTVTGVPHKEDIVEMLKSAHERYVHKETPLQPPLVRMVELDQHRVIYFSVTKSTGSVHLTSDGRCLRRFDRENRPAPAEQIQLDRQEAESREYDRSFVDGATLGDLNVEMIQVVGQDVAPGYSPEKVLQYLRLAEYTVGGLRLRRAALLLFAKDIVKWHPRCAVRVMRVRGIQLGVGNEYNVTQDDQILGNVLELLDKSWETLRPYLARTRFQQTGLFRESLIYPETACREALVNAIAHRDYAREGSPIEVYIFDDRMEFRSPGTLMASLSLNDLARLSGAHESRNVLVARVLRESGYMREMGEGIPRIFRAMRESELVDPELESDGESFQVTLRHKSIFTPQDIEWLDGFREFDLSKNEQRVVLLGRDGRALSTNEIVEIASIVDMDDFRALYDSLRRKGLMHSTKPSSRIRGEKRRDKGRFVVRGPAEVEQFLGELLDALRSLGPGLSLGADELKRLKAQLSPDSPYAENVVLSLRAIGFIDAERRYLPKALGFVPELKTVEHRGTGRVVGEISVVKKGGYGFIRAEGVEYFFHVSWYEGKTDFDALKPGTPVSFRVEPSPDPRQKDRAVEVRLA